MLVKDLQAMLAQMNPDDTIQVTLFNKGQYYDLFEIIKASNIKYKNGDKTMTWATLEVDVGHDVRKSLDKMAVNQPRIFRSIR